MSGIAGSLNLWFTPEADNYPPGTAVKLMPGALDESLRSFRAGRARVSLLLDHDTRRMLCTSRDGLSLWLDGSEIMFALRPRTAAGYAAVAAVHLLPSHRSVSLGFSVMRSQKVHRGGLAALLVTEARIVELSIVRRAAVPVTFVKFNA